MSGSGSVVHFEMPADDLERAQGFYRAAFGWDINAVPGMDYALVTTTPSGDRGPTEPGAINGGMLTRREPVTAPLITIRVDDVDAALAEVERLGGRTVTGRAAVGDMGFTGYFADTEGNIVGLWQDAG